MALGGRRQQLLAQLQADGRIAADVVAAMAAVPREAFVPASLRERAYDDVALPIGEDQTISEPSLLGQILTSLRLKSGSRVLEIGVGSGYVVALLRAMGCAVWGLEVRPSLASRAQQTLASLGDSEARVAVGDAGHGWPQAAPFAAVVVFCAAPRVPDALLAQVADGGVLLMPVGPADGPQHLERWQRRGEALRQETLGKVQFAPWIDARSLAKATALP